MRKITTAEWYVWTLVFALLACIFAWSIVAARSQESPACPPDKTCKTITITTEQEQVLHQIISQTCIQGPYAQMAELVKYYTDLLAKTPVNPKK